MGSQGIVPAAWPGTHLPSFNILFSMLRWSSVLLCYDGSICSIEAMKTILKIRAVIALTFIACSALAYAFPLNVHGLDTLNTAILIRDLRFGHDIVSANI